MHPMSAPAQLPCVVPGLELAHLVGLAPPAGEPRLEADQAGAPHAAAWLDDDLMNAADDWLTQLSLVGCANLAASLEETAAPSAALEQTAPTESNNADEDAVQPANTPVSKRKHAGGRQKGAQLTYDQVKQWQGKPLKEAAEGCGMGTTQFKLQCRKLGIARWPFRKLNSLSILEVHLEEHTTRLRNENGTLPETLAAWMEHVNSIKAAVLSDPATTAVPGAPGALMLRRLEKLRQWDVKFHYNRKRLSRAGAEAAQAAAAVARTVPPHINLQAAPAKLAEALAQGPRPMRTAAANRRKPALP